MIASNRKLAPAPIPAAPIRMAGRGFRVTLRAPIPASLHVAAIRSARHPAWGFADQAWWPGASPWVSVAAVRSSAASIFAAATGHSAQSSAVRLERHPAARTVRLLRAESLLGDLDWAAQPAERPAAAEAADFGPPPADQIERAGQIDQTEAVRAAQQAASRAVYPSRSPLEKLVRLAPARDCTTASRATTSRSTHSSGGCKPERPDSESAARSWEAARDRPFRCLADC